MAAASKMHTLRADQGRHSLRGIGATEDPSRSNTGSREVSSVGITWSAGLVTRSNPLGGNKAAIALTLVQRFSAPASWQLL